MKLLAFLLAFLPFAASAALIHGKDSSNNDQVARVNSSGQFTIALLACEDQTNGVCKVEQQFSYCAGKTADAACGSAGTRFLHSVTCAGTDAAATAGDVTIRDATSAGSGTVVQTIAFAAAYFAPVTVVIDATLSTGIYLDFTTTADVMCSASYR